MYSQIKDRKHIEQNFHSVARVMPWGGTWGAGGVKNFSVEICDGAPSTARSCLKLILKKKSTDVNKSVKITQQLRVNTSSYPASIKLDS